LILTCSPTPSFFCRAVRRRRSHKFPRHSDPADPACVPGVLPRSPVASARRRVSRLPPRLCGQACGDGYRGPKTQGKPFLSPSRKCLCRKAFSQISDFETMPRSGSIHRDT
jgi:hypothetical protein